MGLINKLGIGFLALGLAGSPNLDSEDLLENRVIAAEAEAVAGKTEKSNVPEEEYKESYTFDEVKTALGERYSRLSDAQKKTIEANYRNAKDPIKFSYNTAIGKLYNKKTAKSRDISEDELKEINDFKILKLDGQRLNEYLAAFPWIKKENLPEMDKDPRNLDKMLIYYTEFYRELSGVYTSMDLADSVITGLDLTLEGLNYLSRGQIDIKVQEALREAAFWCTAAPYKIYDKAKSFWGSHVKK
jgi:hypothetical protein